MSETSQLPVKDTKAGKPATTHDVGLTPGASVYFDQAVKEYADKLLNESKNIEEMEHTGAGPAEITAAHVEEAKWVLVRRLRKRVSSSKWIAALRIGQVLMSAVVGVGASNFSQTWGALMCIGGVLIGSILLVLEREFARDI